MSESLLHEGLVSMYQQDEVLLSRVELCELDVWETMRAVINATNSFTQMSLINMKCGPSWNYLDVGSSRKYLCGQRNSPEHFTVALKRSLFTANLKF